MSAVMAATPPGSLATAENECRLLEADLPSLLNETADAEQPKKVFKSLILQAKQFTDALALAVQNEEDDNATKEANHTKEKTQLKRKLDDAASTLRDLEGELYDLEEVTRVQREDIDRRWRHEVALELHGKNLENERKETLEELVHLKKELTVLKDCNAEAASAIASSERRIESTRRELEASRTADAERRATHERETKRDAAVIEDLKHRLETSRTECLERGSEIEHLTIAREKSIFDLEQETERFTTRASYLEKAIEEREARSSELNRELEEVRDTLRTRSNERDKLEAQLAHSEERRTRLTKEYEMKTEDNLRKFERLTETLEETKIHLTTKEQSAALITAELHSATSKINRTESALRKRGEEYDDLLAKHNRTESELQSESARFRAVTKEHEEDVRDLKDEIERISDAAETAKQISSRRTEQIENLKRTSIELQSELENERRNGAKLEQNLEETETAIVALRIDAEKNLAELKHARGALRSSETEAEKVLSTERTTIENSKKTIAALEAELAIAVEASRAIGVKESRASKTLAEREDETKTLRDSVTWLETELGLAVKARAEAKRDAEMTTARLKSLTTKFETMRESGDRKVREMEAELGRRAFETKTLIEKVDKSEAVVAELRERWQNSTLETPHPSVTTPSQTPSSAQKRWQGAIPPRSPMTAVLATDSEEPRTPSKRRKLVGSSTRSSSRFSGITAPPGVPIGAVSNSSTSCISLDGSASSKIKKGKVVITLSGFRDADLVYTLAYREKISAAAARLGAVIREADQEFDQKITHVVCPASSRKTLKVYAASVSMKYIMKPEWVLASAEAGYFLPETDHGVRYLESPFRDKVFFRSPHFFRENTGAKEFRTDNSKTLIETLGGGRIRTTMGSDVDFVLTSEKDVEEYAFGKKLTWKTFLLKIPVPG